jgi:hypothetical protein
MQHEVDPRRQPRGRTGGPQSPLDSVAGDGPSTPSSHGYPHPCRPGVRAPGNYRDDTAPGEAAALGADALEITALT